MENKTPDVSAGHPPKQNELSVLLDEIEQRADKAVTTWIEKANPSECVLFCETVAPALVKALRESVEANKQLRAELWWQADQIVAEYEKTGNGSWAGTDERMDHMKPFLTERKGAPNLAAILTQTK